MENSPDSACVVSNNEIFSPNYPNNYDYLSATANNIWCQISITESGTLTSPEFALGSGDRGSDYFQVGYWQDGNLNEISYSDTTGPNLPLKNGDYITFSPYFGTTGGSFKLKFTPTPSGGGSRTCFARNDTVQLESGGIKDLSDLAIGDRILSCDRNGNFEYSPVVFLPHAPNLTPTAFLEVETSGQKSVRMTRSHLLPLCSHGALVPAKSLAVGHCVRTKDGEETISSIKSVTLEGVFTAVTEKEFLVVNGIVASPFSSLAGVVHALYDTAGMEKWCSSNSWLAFHNAKFGNNPLLSSLSKSSPSKDCMSLLKTMYENYKDEPIGWGVDGWGYQGWKNPTSLISGWNN